MSYIYCNPNPIRQSLTDCTIRAICIVTNQDWHDVFDKMCEYASDLGDMPSTNHVWGAYLRDRGFKRYAIPNTCPDCYTVKDFAYDHPYGKYILATGHHVIAVIDGNYYDTSDSGYETPIYYYERRQ